MCVCVCGGVGGGGGGGGLYREGESINFLTLKRGGLIDDLW